MGIATLGKSLLSSAKKKAKKGQQFGLFAGAAIGIAGAVNKGIREKAVLRAQQWDQSFTPLINSYSKEFATINDTKTDYEKRNDTTKYVNYQESFYKPEIERLTKIVTGGATDKTLSPAELADIRVQAIKNVSDNVLKYETRVEQYKPYFDLDKKAFDDNLIALRAKGVKLISDDSLKKRIGRKFFGSTEGQQLVKKIKMSDTESMDISLPQELMAAMDTTFLNSLAGIKTREVKVSEIEIIDELYNTPADINLLQEKILRDPPADDLSQDTINAVLQIVTPRTKGVGGAADTENINYIGDLTFSNSEKKSIKVPMADLQAILEKTINGGDLNPDSSKNNFTDWDQFQKDIAMLTQASEIEYSRTSNESVVQSQRQQWAANAAVEVARSFTITVKEDTSRFWAPSNAEKLLKKTQANQSQTPTPTVDGELPTTTSTSPEEFKVVKVVDDSLFNKQAVVKIIDTPEWRAMPIEEQFNFFNSLKNQHPNAIKEIANMQRALSENKPLEEVMQDTLSEDMIRVDGTEKSSTGFKGPITNNVDNSTMTEVSVGVMINGKETLVPAISELTTDAQIKVLQDLKIGVDPIPEDIQITAKKAAEARIKAGLNPFYQDEEEKPDTTTTTSTSLLSPSVPTQEELVKEFEILGASKMSPAEIDIRLNDMINRKADFTTDEYIKLITYLNSKQGINPTSSNTSLLKPTKELTDSEIISKSLKGLGTGRNPLEVIDDMNTRNSIRNTNLGLKTLERKTTTARQAIATSGLLRNKNFVEFLESEGTTKDEFPTTTKDYVLNIFNKYLIQLQSN